MPQTTTEIMMQFIGPDGVPIRAECATEMDAQDRLAFQPTPGYAPGFMRGRYFLVDSFRMGMTLNDSEAANKEPPPQPVGPKEPLRQPPGMKGVDPVPFKPRGAPAPKVTNSEGSFMRWRTAAKNWNVQAGDDQLYNARMDDFAFTRRLDIASTVLFTQWFTQTTFPYAAIVKRKSAPAFGQSYQQNLSYLRIDFADVQIAGLQWSDDEIVEESCTFRAKRMLVQYSTLTDYENADADSYMTAYDQAEWINKAATAETGGGADG